MKKRKKQVQKKRYLKKIVLGISLFGIGLSTYVITNKKMNVVKANPTQTITIDKDSKFPFIIPVDSKEVVEPNLSLPNGYVQATSIVPNIENPKDGYSIMGADENINYSKAIPVENGNYIFISSNSKNWTSGVAGQRLHRSELVLFKTDFAGNVLLTMNLGKGSVGSSFSPEGVSTSPYEALGGTASSSFTYAFNGSIQVNNDQKTISVGYNGMGPDINSLTYESNKSEWERRNMNIQISDFKLLSDEIYSGSNSDFNSKTVTRNGDVLFGSGRPYNNGSETYPSSLPVSKMNNGIAEVVVNLQLPVGMKDSTTGRYNSIQIDSVIKVDGGYVSVLSAGVWATSVEKKWYLRSDSTGKVLNYEQFNYSSTVNPILFADSHIAIERISNGLRNYYKLDVTELPSTLEDKDIVYSTSNQNNIKFVYNPNSIFGSEYDVYGAYSDISSIISQGFNISPGALIGTMNSNFQILSMVAIPVSNGVTDMTITADPKNENRVFLQGIVLEDEMEPDFGHVLPNYSQSNNRRIFQGGAYKEKDYSPAINSGSNLVIDIDDVDFDSIKTNSNGWTEKDSVLITGNKEGNFTNNSTSVQVYDSVDFSNNEKIGTDNINRNIRDRSLPIDWSALGYSGDIGGQLVTYFIGDSQAQVTATSKVVNNVDRYTTYEETKAKAALHAKNFTIPLKDVSGLTKEKLLGLTTTKDYGQVLAWDMDTGENLNNKVEIDPGNTDQLKAIQEAKKFGKFPLTYTVTNNGETVTKSTWVFVMDENSEAIGDTVFIFNGNDFKLPWDESSVATETALTAIVMEKAEVEAYDFETGKDVTSDLVPKAADLTTLKGLEPTDTANPPTTKNPTVGIHFVRGKDETKKTVTAEVYYRFETIKVSFVDVNFGQLYDVEANKLTPLFVDLPNQIVGKKSVRLVADPELELKTDATLQAGITQIEAKGYEREKLYQSNKKTVITTPDIPVTYEEGKGIQVYLTFKGLLTLVSVPETIDFKLNAVNPKKNVRVDDPTVKGDLVVSDTRAGTDNKWTLKVSLSKPIQSTNTTGAKVTLPNALQYKPAGKDEFTVTSEAQEITREDSGFGTYDVSSAWGSTKEATGFKFDTPAVYVARLGEYKGEITYSISDTFEP